MLIMCRPLRLKSIVIELIITLWTENYNLQQQQKLINLEYESDEYFMIRIQNYN